MARTKQPLRSTTGRDGMPPTSLPPSAVKLPMTQRRTLRSIWKLRADEGRTRPKAGIVARHGSFLRQAFTERDRVRRGAKQQDGVVGGSDAFSHHQGVEVDRLAGHAFLLRRRLSNCE